MPPPEAYKNEIGSQPTICQVHTVDADVSLLVEKHTIPLATQKDYNAYIARSTYHYAYARQTHVNWKKETKKTKEDKGNERKDKKAKKTKKERKLKERKEKTRRESKERKGEKYVILADPWS